MTKHVMALTYKPKIEPVREGRCRQTIRKGNRVAVDDEILIHGWAGKPYQSKWSWRMRVTGSDVTPIFIDDVLGVGTLYRPKSNVIKWHPWDSEYTTRLAVDDFIEPATGAALREVLFGVYGAPDGVEEYQVVRW